MPDINIASGEGERENTSFFTGLLPLCPKSSGQGCSKGSEGLFVKFIFKGTNLNKEEQEWCRGESTRLPPMWPRFDSRTQRHMWAEFVVGSCPCSKVKIYIHLLDLFSLRLVTYALS